MTDERSAEDNARERLASQAGYKLRVLAANLLRVVRGAGDQYLLSQQILDYTRAAEEYSKVYNRWPDTAPFLDFDHDLLEFQKRHTREEIDRWKKDGTLEQMRAYNTICSGALQIVASRLAGQQAQENAGKRELRDGVDDYNLAREAQRKRRPS
jgi:hypothetical protein